MKKILTAITLLLSHLSKQLDREQLLFVPLHHVGANMGLGELANGFGYQYLVLGRLEIHRINNNS